MNAYDSLSEVDKTEYIRLYQGLAPDPKNRGSLDSLVSVETYAHAKNIAGAYSGISFEQVFNAIQSNTGVLSVGGGDAPVREIAIPKAPLTPALALSLDIGKTDRDQTLFDKVGSVVNKVFLAYVAVGAAVTPAAGAPTTAGGTFGTEATATSTANGAANASSTVLSPYIAAPNAAGVPEYIALGTQPAASVGTQAWATDTIAAALNPSSIDLVGAGFLSRAGAVATEQAGKIAGGKLASAAAGYLGNTADFQGEQPAGDNGGSNFTPLLIVGGSLVAVGLIVKFFMRG